MKKPRIIFGCLLSCLVMLGTGCGQPPSGDADSPAAAAEGAATTKQEVIQVALLPKLKGISYFTSCYEGAQEAADELDGVELIYNGPTTASADKQAQMIDKWRLQGIDVIAVAPNDPAVLSESLQKVRAAGVTVITWDSDSLPADRSFYVVPATAETIGKSIVDIMARDLGGAGEVAIVSATATAANQNEWMGHMAEQFKQYPDLTLVATKYPGEDQNNAFQDSQDLIKKFPALKGIFGITSVSFPGAAEAVKQSGKTGEVLVPSGFPIPETAALEIAAGDLAEVEVIDSSVDELDTLIINSLHEDPTKSHDEALLKMRRSIRRLYGAEQSAAKAA